MEIFMWHYTFLFMKNKTKLKFSPIKYFSTYKQGSKIHREKNKSFFSDFLKGEYTFANWNDLT